MSKEKAVAPSKQTHRLWVAALYSRDLPAVSAAAAFAATCRGVETLVQGTSGMALNARWLAGWVSVSEQTRWGALGASSCTASSSSCMILPPPVKQTAMSLELPTTSFSIEIKLVAGSSGKVQRSVRASFATLLKLLIENPSPSELADASAKLSATVSARTPVQMLHELSLPSSGSSTIWANHTPPAASTFEQLVASLAGSVSHPLEAELPSETLGRFAALAGVGMDPLAPRPPPNAVAPRPLPNRKRLLTLSYSEPSPPRPPSPLHQTSAGTQRNISRDAEPPAAAQTLPPEEQKAQGSDFVNHWFLGELLSCAENMSRDEAGAAAKRVFEFMSTMSKVPACLPGRPGRPGRPACFPACLAGCLSACLPTHCPACLPTAPDPNPNPSNPNPHLDLTLTLS